MYKNVSILILYIKMGYYVELKNDILDCVRKSGIRKINQMRLFKTRLIPISILEQACKLNLKDKFCNINLQYLWFVLNNNYVYRKFSTGWKKFKVSFSDTYVEDSEKNKKIILDAYNSCSKPKTKIFSNITGKCYVSIREYISGKNKIPLSTFIKSCQLLSKDPWQELDNSKIYSGSSTRFKFIMFKNKITPELYILLNWINLEGNIAIDRPSITISQHINEKQCLNNLVKYFEEVFGINSELIRIQQFKSRPSILYLVVYSSPLRQILALKYEIPLGYKSRIVKPNPSFIFDRENNLRVLASEVETEGSFAKHNRKNVIHCDLSFSTYSKEYSKSFFNRLKGLGYSSSFIISRRERFGIREVEYKVSFWRCLDIQKFAFEVVPYIFHKSKLRNLVEVIRQKNYLKITRLDFNEAIKNLIYKAKNMCGGFKFLTKELNDRGLDLSTKAIEAWVYQHHKVPVYAILQMCEIMAERNYFIYIPKELALSLWLQGFINREEAEDLRGIRNAYRYVDFILNE